MRNRGYTLIEVLMVVVIIGSLAAMTLPRFIDLQGRGKQAATRGSLGSIRSAIVIAYSSNAAAGDPTPIPDTIVPSMFQDNQIPMEQVTGTKTNEVTYVASAPVTAGIGWAYDSTLGKVWVNHSDYTDW